MNETAHATVGLLAAVAVALGQVAQYANLEGMAL